MTSESAWQPIETAPTDGTWILASTIPCPVPAVIKWEGKWIDGEDDETGNHSGYYEPTHWMPLPEPPSDNR